MMNPDLFLAGTHAPPSEVSFQGGEPTRPLSECPASYARAGQRPKPLSEAGWLLEVVQGEPFRCLCRHSRRAASAAWSTGGRLASFGGWAYRSNICVAAAVTPRATVVANSGVDIDPGAVGAFALGGT